jgi:hypothetical protein
MKHPFYFGCFLFFWSGFKSAKKEKSIEKWNQTEILVEISSLTFKLLDA